MNRREFLKCGAVGAALPLVGCATGQCEGGGADAGMPMVHRIPDRKESV